MLAMSQIAIHDVAVEEGDLGDTRLIFEVALLGGNVEAVSVDYQTVDDTATVADGDYEAKVGNLTWEVGDTTSRFIVINAAGDSRFETDESFRIELTNVQGAELSDGTAIGTLLDDDTVLPGEPIGNVSDAEFAINAIRPANASEQTFGSYWGYDGARFEEFNGRVYFAAAETPFSTYSNYTTVYCSNSTTLVCGREYDDGYGRLWPDPTVLWSIDPATQEYAKVADVSVQGINETIVANEKLFFTAYAGNGKYKLYSWGGPGNAPVFLTHATDRAWWSVGDKLYFIGDDAETGNELWVTNGQPGIDNTHPVKDHVTGPPSPILILGNSAGEVLGGQFLFWVISPAGTPERVTTYITDGSAAGTRVLLTTSSPPTFQNPNGSATFDGQVYFQIAGQLYRTDGEQVEPLAGPVPASEVSHYSDFYADDGKLFFTVRKLDSTAQYWQYDGNSYVELDQPSSAVELPRGLQHRGQVFRRNGGSGFAPDNYGHFDIATGEEKEILDDGGLSSSAVYARIESGVPIEELLYANTGPSCLVGYPFVDAFNYPTYCDSSEAQPPVAVATLPEAVLPEEVTLLEGSIASLDVFDSILLEPDHQLISWDTDFDGTLFVERVNGDVIVPLDTTKGPSSYQVALRVQDTWGHESIAVTQVNVANEKPTVEGLSDISGPVGSPIQISANIFDPGVNDTLNIRWEIDNVLVAEDVTSFEQTFTEVGEHFATLTVTDSDTAETVEHFRIVVGPPVTVQASATSIAEGESVRLTASLAAPVSEDVLVPLSYSGSAESAADFGESLQAPQPPTHIRIPAGSTSGFVDVTNLQDSIDEEVETLEINAGIPSNASLGSTTAIQVDLTDDDDAPLVFIDSTSQVIAEQRTTLPVAVSLDAVSGRDVVIKLAPGGTASAGSDYVLGEQLLLIPAGELSATTTLTILDDNLGEGTEQIVVSVDYAQNAVVSGAALTHVVPANDIPIISFDSVLRNVSEAAGTHEIVVSISNPADSEIAATVALSGNAVSGVDYAVDPLDLDITFSPGQTLASIPITLIDNGQPEPDRWLVASIFAISGATPGPTLGQLTKIVDDDSFFLSLSAPTSAWEDAGFFVVRASLTKQAIEPITVPLDFGGTAVRDRDYSVTFDSITIPQGQTFGEVAVVFDDDFVPEPNLRVDTTLVTPPTVKLQGQATVATTIRDNDPIVRFSSLGRPVSTMLLKEGDGSSNVQIYLDRPVNNDITVNLNAYAKTASKHDFSVPRTVTIPADPIRPAAASFAVTPIDDSIDEARESFSIAISSISNGQGFRGYPSVRAFEILDNDAPPEPYWFYPGVPVQEGSSSLIFVGVELARTAETDVHAKISLSGTAILGADYQVLGEDASTFTLTFPAGVRKQLIPIQIVDDGAYEGTEYIDMHLSTGGRDPKTFTIPLNDNDSKPRKRSSFESFIEKTGNLINEVFVEPFELFKESISTTAMDEAWESLRNTNIDDFKNGEAAICLNDLTTISLPFGFEYKPGLCLDGDQIEWFVAATIDFIRNPEAIHGAVDGATLFVDLNFNEVQDFLDLNSNGIQDLGERSEPSFETDYDGAASIAISSDMDANRNGRFDDDELQLVSIGGTDVSTGYEISVPMVAPASFSVVSPLTTLVAKLSRLKGVDTEQAMVRVVEALDLPRKELLNVNLLSLARNDDLLAAVTFAKSTQVYSTTHQIAYFLSGFDSAPEVRLLGSLAMQDMAEKIRSDGSLLDLSDVFVVQSLIQGTITRSGIVLQDSNVAAAAATVIANSNAMMASVDEVDGRAFLEEVARIQKVSEGSAAAQLQALAAGMATEQDTVNEFTGDGLATLVAASDIGNVVIPYIVADDISVIEGDEGTQMAVVNVGLTDPSNLPVSVNYSTADVSATAGSDYGSVSGTLSWSPGETTVQQIQIPIYGDGLSETNELFHVLWTDAVNAATLETISYAQILSDDPIGVALDDATVDHTLHLQNANGGLQLFDNGDVIFEGTITAEQELFIESVAGSQSELTVAFEPEGSASWGAVKYLGNGANSSLEIDPSSASSIEHVLSSTEHGRFEIDGQVVHYANVGTVLSSASPTISGVPAGAVGYGDLLTLVGAPPASFDANVAVDETWTLTRDGVEVESVAGNSLSISVDDFGVYRMTYRASQEGYLPAVATFEFAITNAPPVGNDDGAATDEDSSISVVAANGLLANDVDESPGELRVTSVNGAPITETSPFEFASAIQDSNVSYATINVNAGNYYGVRFEVTEPIKINRVGASFGYGSGDDPFAAIVQLDGAIDLPDSFDLSTPDVLARTTIPVAFNDSGDRYGAMDLDLQPGWYALMIGGEGNSNAAFRLDNATQVNNSLYLHSRLLVPEYFSITPANPTSRIRFLVEGSSVGGAATITLDSGATLVASADGSFTYDPNGSFEGLGTGQTATDSFSYTLVDSFGFIDDANVSITVNGVNDAPVAEDDSYVVSEDSLARPATSVGFFANDSDVDDASFSLVEINGTPIIQVDDFEFESAVPDPALSQSTTSVNSTNYYGTRFYLEEATQIDRVGVAVQHAGGESVFAAISRLDGALDYPDSLTLQGADLVTSTTIPVSPLFVGDVFADVNVGLGPGWYSLVIGTEAFNASGVTNLLLNHTPVGDPSLFHVAVGLNEFREVTAPSLDGRMRFILQGQAAGGETTIELASGVTVIARSNGTIEYDPTEAFNYLPAGQDAVDQFPYRIADTDGLADEATVQFTVRGVNDSAIINGPTGAEIPEDTDFIVGTLSVSDVDQGEAFFVVQDTVGSFGRLLLNADGGWSYDLDNAAVQSLNNGDTETDAFTVVSYDGTATATLTISILGGNDSDTDGVGDDIEFAAGEYCTIDGFRDCNQDGVEDGTQEDHIATLPNGVTGSAVTIASADGTTLTNVISTTTPSFDVALPEDAEFPIGFTQFTVELAPETDSTEVTLFFEAEQPFNAVYKFGYQPGQDPTVDEPSVFEFPKYDPEAGGVGAEILPDRIVLHLVDGQLGDLDLLVNGFISDPIGLALVPGGGDDYVGVNEDSAVTFNPLLNDVLDGPLEVTAWTPTALGEVSYAANEGFTFTPAANANGADEYSYTVRDGDGTLWMATVFLTINPINDVPTVGVNDDSAVVTVDEGATAYAAGTWNDIDAGDAVSFAASIGTVEGHDNGSWTWAFEAQDGPTESQNVTITAIDAAGASATTTFTLGVNNVAPHNVTIAPEVSEYVFAVGALKVFEGQFADVSSLDTHNGDGTYWTFSHVNEAGETIVETATATVTQGVGGGSVSDEVSFDVPGVYHVTLTVTDDDGASTTSAPSIFVVYDPSAGFVTGGGWIDSPAGADRLNPETAGRANFGFVSKYKRGATAPSGQTTFNFKAGDLEFESDSYEWLVVAGARAQFKGVGTINEVGNYGFLLTAIDGQVSGGGDLDKFRIKIWDIDNDGELRYDNQETTDSADDAVPSSALGGGQILIHTGGKRHVAAALSLYDDSFDTSSSNNSPYAPIVDEAVDFVFLPGDANLDLKVSEEDFEILSANFGRLDAEWTDGDFDGSGIVDFEDFLLLSKALG